MSGQTELPRSLKHLVQKVMRGFYPIDHVIVVDLLIRRRLIKEDDIIDLLKFERKQLRSVLAMLEKDKLTKKKLRIETGIDGKSTKHHLYYINYKAFVNVVKYKLDHMRKKIELEERDLTARASFVCDECHKTFTDLEVDQLLDPMSGDMRSRSYDPLVYVLVLPKGCVFKQVFVLWRRSQGRPQSFAESRLTAIIGQIQSNNGTALAPTQRRRRH